MCEFEATHQEHLGKVAQAQLVSQTPKHYEEHYVCWELQVIVWGASALVEDAMTRSTLAWLLFLGMV